MALQVLGEAVDVRTQTRVIYAKSDIQTYVALIGADYDEFMIQRRRVKHKAYSRMRADIIAGTLLPTITLAVKNDFIQEVSDANGNDREIARLLSLPDRVNILDGLQRTHTLIDILKEGIDLNKDQTILLEFWLEKDIRNLIYRIIVLNAGQKPMSMRHQIELLFYSTIEILEKAIPGLEVFAERDEARRTRPKKYSLDRLSLAYYAYLTKSPEIDKDNLIAQQLQEDEILAEGEEKFGEKFDRFISLLKIFSLLDEKICEIYPDAGLAWIGSENVMLTFFAAAANFETRPEGRQRIDDALAQLLLEFVPGSDPMALEQYRSIILGVNVRKVNVGFATRKLLFNAFREFFWNGGATPFAQLWVREAT